MRHPKTYPPELKERLIRRMLAPESASPVALSKETGVSQTTLWRWRQSALAGSGEIETGSSPDARSPQEKVRLVVASDALSGQELGAFLRTEGVHLADLQRWREQMLAALSPTAPQDASVRKELRELRQEKDAIERELRRKVAALAETAALLVLSKKARRLWEDEDAPTAGKTDKTF